jgi:hypothetical protein
MAAVTTTVKVGLTLWKNRGLLWKVAVLGVALLFLPVIIVLGLGGAVAVNSVEVQQACGWTVPGDGPIASGFGPRNLVGLPRASKNHQGVDLGGADNPIYAAADGTVTFAGFGDQYGIIKIDHGEGLYTRYLHMWDPTKYVRTGDGVKSGEQIGENGCSAPAGGCSGPHLHFEVRPGDVPTDPVEYYAGLGLQLGVDPGGTSQPCEGTSVVGNLEGTPKEIARALLADHGWDSEGEWAALEQLWTKESSWNPDAVNPSSGACGIPQALPCEKMSKAGDDYRTNPETQIRWGLEYIGSRYGSPSAAWAFWQRMNWY